MTRISCRGSVDARHEGMSGPPSALNRRLDGFLMVF
jgi:hypothetical protein